MAQSMYLEAAVLGIVKDYRNRIDKHIFQN
jgi:hypothetical protein